MRAFINRVLRALTSLFHRPPPMTEPLVNEPEFVVWEGDPLTMRAGTSADVREPWRNVVMS